MAKEDGVRTVVVGGKIDIPQQYCGTVGGQSTHFAMVDTEIKACFVLTASDIYISSEHDLIDHQTQETRACSARLVCKSFYYLLTQSLQNMLQPSLTNSVQGITWRLGFGIDNPEEPEGMNHWFQKLVCHDSISKQQSGRYIQPI